MNSATFTRMIARLLVDMELKGERPLGVSLNRSLEEQARLFRIGRTFDDDGNVFSVSSRAVTNCDGVKKVSGHQRNAALDILFQSAEGTKPELVEPIKGWKFWHERWEGFGGKPMIVGDECHFEG